MNITYEKRLELNALSKEVFGVSSRWRTMIKQGYVENRPNTSTIFERKKVVVPGAKGRAGKPQGQIRKTVTKYHTLESIEQLMLQEKDRLVALKIKAESKVNEENSKT